MVEKPNILIAVPAYGGLVCTDFATSLYNLAKIFDAQNISNTLVTANHSDIVDTRNYFGSLAARLPTISHVLMSDNDMSFRPEAVLSLLSAKRDVIGCAVPTRSETSIPFFNLVEPTPTETRSIYRVKRIGAGLLLVRRSVFTTMQETGRLRKQQDHRFTRHFPHPLYGFFDRIDHSEGRLGEDYSFCERWRDIGGEVFALTSETIGHAGLIRFSAKYDEYNFNSESPTAVDRQLGRRKP